MKYVLKITLPVVLLAMGGCSSMSENDINHQYDSLNTAPYDDSNRSDVRISHIVEFAFGSAEIPQSASEVVKPHARYLIANPQLKVAIQGNASDPGNEQYNYKLAKRRAEAVKNLFIELGVDESQLVALSVGEIRSKTRPNRSVVLAY